MAKPLDGLREARPDADTQDGDEAGMMSVPKHEIFQKASQGPFKCSNCEYYKPNECTNKFIIKLRGSTVAPDDCCDLFEKR